MKIQAEVVADSLSPYGNRLTTLLVTMPRYILAEFNTHRMLSKNSASSRAIPFEKNLKSVMENPFIPVAWMKDHKGMQGTEYITDIDTVDALETIWRRLIEEALYHSKQLYYNSLTKQLCNRPLEAYMWHTVLVSATEWENFFALRCPQYVLPVGKGERYFRSRKDYMRAKEYPHDIIGSLDDSTILDWLKINRGQADIHMMLTAEAIWDAMNESTPKQLQAGDWHMPFGDNIEIEKLEKAIDASGVYGAVSDYENFKQNSIIKVSTARCAQTSYTVIGEDEKEMNYEKLIALHDRLVKSGHWSPFEHCARVMSEEEYYENFNGKFNPVSYEHISGWSGNFRGFIQYRKMFANENIS